MAGRHTNHDKRLVEALFTELVTRVQTVVETLAVSPDWVPLMSDIWKGRWG